ncbi:hypothetical protein BD626DRAFT_525468 [Schizophyllum amplum]|uniref:Uncharacterized protein n=1 Tax=Schizophyllum amplum TaxID=97359 RepID=A0A550BSH3_9AGAR|nr:hypothetical protein BD626DRAFT_525468 [Auriculariopsis ampla]
MHARRSSSYDLGNSDGASTWDFDMSSSYDMSTCDPEYVRNLEARVQALLEQNGILAMEKKTVQDALQSLIQSVGDKLSMEPAVQASPQGSVLDRPAIVELNSANFPKAKYWYKDEQPAVGGKRKSKVSRTDQPSNAKPEKKFATPYITDIEGRPVDTAHMRFRLYAICQQLVLWGIAPRTWCTIGHEALQYTIANMEDLFPILRLCDGHWKLIKFGTYYYPSWWGTYGPNAAADDELEAPVTGSKRSSPSNEDDGPAAKRARYAASTPSDSDEPVIVLEVPSAPLDSPLATPQEGVLADAPSDEQAGRVGNLLFSNPLAEIELTPSSSFSTSSSGAGVNGNNTAQAAETTLSAPEQPSPSTPSVPFPTPAVSSTTSTPASTPTAQSAVAPETAMVNSSPAPAPPAVPKDGLPPWTGLPDGQLSARKKIQINKKSTTARALCQADFVKKYHGFSDEFKHYWDNVILPVPSLLQFWEERSRAAGNATEAASA